jgi:hypothetical protein
LRRVALSYDVYIRYSCCLENTRLGQGRQDPRKNFRKAPLWRHNCKKGEAVFYNILHFIGYYPAQTQLGFISLS